MAGRPFSELVGLSPETLEVLAACGFERATPVQVRCAVLCSALHGVTG